MPRLSITGPRRIELGRERIPTPTGTEVLVKVQRVGICATDLALYNGTYAGARPGSLCFGHEWSGVVQQIGAGVGRVAVGSSVVGECLMACQSCAACARDQNLCPNVRKFGITVDGAARGALVIDEAHLHVVDPHVTPELMAFAEPLSVGLQAVARGAAAHDMPLSESRILVMGGGMIGLGCLFSLRLYHGCDPVYLEDPLSERMRHALMLGATPTHGFEPPPPPGVPYAAHFDLSPLDDSGFDLVVETSGSTEGLQRALAYLRPGGTLVLVGFSDSLRISPRQLSLKANRIVGSVGGTGQFEAAVRLVQAHGELLRPLITHEFPLDQYEAAFEAASDRRAAVKVQLTLDS